MKSGVVALSRLFSNGAAICAFVLVVAGCSGDAEDPADAAAWPAVTDAEFAATVPPSVDTFVAAYDRVIGTQPVAATSDAALSRLLFDLLRSTPPTAGVDAEHLLTAPEFKLAIQRPRAAYQAFLLVPFAEAAAVDNFPCDAVNAYVDGKADATRHAYWSALMTSQLGAPAALAIGIAHETDAPDPQASVMDLHNDLAGVALGLAYPGASEAELLQLVLAMPTVHVSAAEVESTPAGTLVYYTQPSPFDGVMTGFISDSLSSSDPVTVEFTQCDAVVRGRLERMHDGQATTRRFDGSIGAAGVTLVFRDPLPFEGVSMRSECLAMQGELVGVATKLSGSWSSSTCPDGGMLTLARP